MAALGLLTPAVMTLGQGSTSAGDAPQLITLDEAMKRAEASEPGFAAARAEAGVARQDRWIARAGLMPRVEWDNSGLFSQTSHGQTTPRFIANNAAHEYTSQAAATETMSLGLLAEVRRADAAAARMAAEMEIARRGLGVAVTSLYYGVAAADARLAVAARARGEAEEFVAVTRKREDAREAAHADVVKAQLAGQQRSRELADARAADEKARLELAVLLFADPRAVYAVDGEPSLKALPTHIEAQQAAAVNNPELKSALAALRESDAGVLAARASLLPEIVATGSYGIDAPQFAVNAPDHTSNLGYSAGLTINLPVWDWLATGKRIRQSEIRRDAAKVTLTAAERRAVADLDEAYTEAATAAEQLALLDESVGTATESLRLTKMRYNEGEATVLEVVDAEGAFVDAENARLDGRVRAEAARAALETLTGKL